MKAFFANKLILLLCCSDMCLFSSFEIITLIGVNK